MGFAELHDTFARGLLRGQHLFSATLCGYAARELELHPLVLQPFDNFFVIEYYSEATPMEFDYFCNNEVLWREGG